MLHTVELAIDHPDEKQITEAIELGIRRLHEARASAPGQIDAVVIAWLNGRDVFGGSSALSIGRTSAVVRLIHTIAAEGLKCGCGPSAMPCRTDWIRDSILTACGFYLNAAMEDERAAQGKSI